MKLIMEVGARDKMKIHLIKNGGAHGAVGGRLLRACCFPPWGWSYQVFLAFFFFKYFPLLYVSLFRCAKNLFLHMLMNKCPTCFHCTHYVGLSACYSMCLNFLAR